MVISVFCIVKGCNKKKRRFPFLTVKVLSPQYNGVTVILQGTFTLVGSFTFSFCHNVDGKTSIDNADAKPRPKSAPIRVEEEDSTNNPVLTGFEMKTMET